ncbi:MAG: two-component system LytT family response regulator [Phenylobacterium sp.]|jgi:two-component system LytT family response regulator
MKSVATHQSTAQRAPSYFERHFSLMSGQFTPPEILEEDHYSDGIMIRTGAETLRLSNQMIHSIEAAGDYMCFNCINGKTHVVRKTMKQLEGELDPEQFIRIHRSNMVNKNKISHVTNDNNGDVVVLLDNGQSLKVSRRYKSRIADRIKPYLYN